MTGLMLECSARSDVGRRPNNEDAVFASPRLAAVADGVGGAAAGEVASRTLINALVHVDKCRLQGRVEDALAEGIARGNETIGFIAGCRPAMAGMSTTVTAGARGDDGRGGGKGRGSPAHPLRRRAPCPRPPRHPQGRPP